jgi:serine/threonine protein kinase
MPLLSLQFLTYPIPSSHIDGANHQTNFVAYIFFTSNILAHSGAFSEVKVAVEKASGNKFAIKIIDKAKCKGKESMIETEVNILMRVRHDNIIQLYEMYEIDNKIYLVMEL